MATNHLTDAQIRALKPGEKPQKVRDGEGLFLLVQPNGTKLWRFAYRFHGKQKTLAVGVYPHVGLGDARDKRDDAKKLLAAGEDPALAKKLDKTRRRLAAENTFKTVALRWHDARKARWTTDYAERIWQRIEDHVLPEIGSLPVHEIEPPTLLAAVRKVEKRGTVELARRVKNYCGQIFRYAIAEGIAVRDPSADIREALATQAPVKHRAALKAAELPVFMEKLANFDGEPLTELALRFTLLTWARTDEVRFADAAEFEDLDGERPLWRIPKARMKRQRVEHLVPLSPPAVTVVKQIKKLQGKSRLLFDADTRSGVISENTMLFALYRMGYHGRATVHGFRGTASTILNEHGFNRDWIERQLAHIEDDEVRAAYNSAEWLPQRREMLTWWGDYLDRQAEVGALVG